VNDEPRKRLFIGIAYQPTAPVSTVLNELGMIARDPATGLRPVPPENLHITLKFLGMVPESHIDAICQVMNRVLEGREPFELQIVGFGCFRQALWLGVDRSHQLDEMAAALDTSLEALGFPRNSKPYRPHLTVARLRTSARLSLSDLQARFGDRHWGRLTVDAIHLYESWTLPGGVAYKKRYSRGLTL